MKTILVPTDFSDPARNALRYAFDLFGPGAHYVLMNAFEDRGSTSPSLIPLKNILHEASVDALEEEKEYMRQVTGVADLQITTASVHSDPVSATLSCAHEYEAEAIVMGATGATGFQGATVGQVAGQVMQRASCTVVVVPPACVCEPKKILLVSGLEAGHCGPLPGWLHDIAKTHHSEIVWLTSGMGPDAGHVHGTGAQAEFLSSLQKLDLRVERINAAGEGGALIDQVREAGADLVVAFSGKTPLWQLFIGSQQTSGSVAVNGVPLMALAS